MTTTQQPEAIRLAEWIESDMSCDGDAEIAAELRRLHARVVELENITEAAKRGFSEITKSRDYWKSSCITAENSIPTRAMFRHLVDVVWNECTESKEVPSTDWADRMIEKSLSESPYCISRNLEPMSDDQMWELVKDVDPDNRILAGRAVERYFLGE